MLSGPPGKAMDRILGFPAAIPFLILSFSLSTTYFVSTLVPSHLEINT
jgi:hypothetical protein